MIRSWLKGALVVALIGGVLPGCGGGTSSEGFFEVAITKEELETAQGNRCAVRGNATNVGNLTARVELAYEARNATGAVIGTSTASFEVAPFSNFEFKNSEGNQAGQPSSTVFTNNLSCSGISSFKRVKTDISKA